MGVVTLTNQERDFSIDTPPLADWSTMRVLLAEIEAEMSERRQMLLARVSWWFLAVRMLKRVTDAKMILREPEKRDYQYHRAILAGMIGTGRTLLLQLELNSIENLEPVGHTIGDFEAMVVELEYQSREWYGDMKEAMRKDILQKCGLVSGE